MTENDLKPKDTLVTRILKKADAMEKETRTKMVKEARERAMLTKASPSTSTEDISKPPVPTLMQRHERIVLTALLDDLNYWLDDAKEIELIEQSITAFSASKAFQNVLKKIREVVEKTEAMLNTKDE